MDDIVFIGEANVHNIVVIKCVLRCFELTSDLEVNFHKSKLVGVAVDGSILFMYAYMLNCKQMYVPFVYLGIPVGGRSNGLQLWEPIIQKVRNKLSRWKHRTVFFGEWIFLI